MALNFVAAEDGLEDDPKVLAFARHLKTSRALAFWFVMRWRRLIVHVGNVLTGALPKSYTVDDVAAFLEWTGKPAALFSAMKLAGFATWKRGRGLVYPGWPATVTGHYASIRERERRRKDENRKNRGADSPRTGGGQLAGGGADSPRTGGGDLTLRNEVSAERPPDPPPAGGAFLAEERWRWLLENAPTPQDPAASMKILATMSADDWTACQGAYLSLKSAVGTPSRKNVRVLQWPTDLFLKKHAYLRFRERKRPSIKREAPPKPAENPAEALERRLAASDSFLEALFADPDVGEDKKSAARAEWLADAANNGRRPPWVPAEAGEPPPKPPKPKPLRIVRDEKEGNHHP